MTGHAVSKAAAPETKRAFHGTQFGMAPGGGEHIVHSIRRFIETGQRPDSSFAGPDRVVIAIDAKNAFNRVSRTAMFREAGKIGAFHCFLKLAYQRPSRLIFPGHVGDDVHLWSKEGVRQGEVGGCWIYNMVQQQCINAALSAVPGAIPLAYIDDTYILADDLESAYASFTTYADMVAANGGEINDVKCEILSCSASPLALGKMERFKSFKIVTVLKALGASVGLCRKLEKEHLEARMRDKFTTVIRRLRLCPSPQLFAVLRSCVLPKLGHALRTHSPEVTRDLCQLFDALISDTVRHWASLPTLSRRQLALIQLPLQLGGMGFYSQEAIAPAAYKASLASALRGQSVIGAAPIRQSVLVDSLYQAMLDEYTRDDPGLVAMLAHARLKGADCGLSYCLSTVHPDVYGALLRTTLFGCSAAALLHPSGICCPGCDMLLSSSEFAHHVTGCVRIKGGLVTVRHDAVVHWTRRLFAEAGDLPDAEEPRHLRDVHCGCGKSFPFDAFQQHKQRSGCTAAKFHTSGPDILSRDFQLPMGSTVASDVTIFNWFAKSNIGRTIPQIVMEKTNEKTVKYGPHLADACVTRFDVLAATSNGFLGDVFVKQIKRCCSATLQDPAWSCLMFLR